MQSKPSAPRGRPANYVKDKNGKPIIGLSLTSQGRYYATHSKPRKMFGRDFDEALRRFREWQGGQRTRIMVPVKKSAYVPMEKVRVSTPKYKIELPEVPFPKDQPDVVTESQSFTVADQEGLYEWARTEILDNPARFAEGVGIPQIAHLKDVSLPKESPTLASIIKTYTKNARVTQHERQKSERYWKEFRKFAPGKSIRDITQEQIAKYHDWAMEEYEKGKSRTWVAHRFGKIKSLLNFAATRGVAPTEIAEVLAYCKMLRPPRKESADPHPISREDFQALLEVADAKWKAMLLCMLNCALYGKEVGELLKQEVDLDKRTLVTERGKTGMVRVAVLWTRTVKAIRAAPHHPGHPSLFQNAAGSKYHPDHIRRGFNRLRAEAGVSSDVKVSDIRDGAYTAAITGGADANQAMLLAGHRTGMKDAYVRRNPKMVADACAAIEAAYFDDADQIDGA